ncbi:MAG: chorismate synthase [Phycisphaerales bacterium]
MARLEHITAGESHGAACVAVVSGMPAGLHVEAAAIDGELARRQRGYGRGARQRIEDDCVEFLSGLRDGLTIGSPVVMVVRNKDSRIDDAERTPPMFQPRPGHADLAGAIKYLTTDARGVVERASARETASRTTAGALAHVLLREVGIEVLGFVRAIGGVETEIRVEASNARDLRVRRDASDVACPDEPIAEKMRAVIREAKENQDTLGGLVEAHVFGCPPGLGSCMDWRDKLDSRLAAAAMGIQAIKGVEIGLGFEAARRAGSRVHDEIHYDKSRRNDRTLGFVRPTNNAGGLEGGMTNGQAIVVRAAMKPISTLLQGMKSVDLNTKESARSVHERSDVCAVPAASVVLENVVAFEVARALLEKFAGDTMVELRQSLERYLEDARLLPMSPGEMRLA